MTTQHSTIEIQKPDIRLKVVVSIAGMVSLIILAVLFRNVATFVIAGAGTIIIAGYGVTVYLKLQHGRHDLRRLEAETKTIEEKSKQEAIITRQLELSSTLHQTKEGVFVYGGLDKWTYIPSTANERRELLPANVIEQESPLDLLTVFTQPTQSYACIGGQQTGKTFQMRHIANHWVRNGISPIVVGPKWDSGEWSDCQLFGGKGDFNQVESGIATVRQIAQQRHSDTIRHKDHPILPVFFDDWTPIVDAVSNAREMVLQATTLYSSVNIILYFILHSDTANAWGVDRKGSALKDNFIKLFIVPFYDSNGLIVRDKTTGYIKFAGDSKEYPTRLFNNPLGNGNGKVILPELKPQATDFDFQAFDFWVLVEDYGQSRNEAHKEIFGTGYGGRNVDRLNDWRTSSAFALPLNSQPEEAEEAEEGLK